MNVKIAEESMRWKFLRNASAVDGMNLSVTMVIRNEP